MECIATERHEEKMVLDLKYRPRQAKTCLQACAKCAFRSSCVCANFHPSLCSPFIYFVLSKDSVSGQ